ncbi:hypothetical protein AAVH_14003 [Aphelenchoides avenae]|nr:hypothetical protein AAVH_14003 [Aphelenchus avenae]
MKALVIIVLAILPVVQSQCANGTPRLGACIGGLCPTGYTCDATGADCCQNAPVVPPNPPVVPPNPPVVPPNPPNPGGGGGGGCTNVYGQLCTRYSQYCNVYPFSLCMQSNCAQTCGTCGTAAAARGGYGGYGGFGSLFGFGSRYGYGR